MNFISNNENYIWFAFFSYFPHPILSLSSSSLSIFFLLPLPFHLLHIHLSVHLQPAYSDPGRSAMLSGSEGTLAQLLSQSKEENKMLRLDVTELKCKLHDAQADIKVHYQTSRCELRFMLRG